MLDDFIRAIALVLVIEGILPFLSPDGWRQAMIQAGRLTNTALRTVGFVSMLFGVLILYLTR
ncbi:MAG: DUF2065 domain-containing protein [Gammaproteobacteria bacterium]|nr:DUF2065 domain-containing protein [Gammaproteobacteria bacterium]NNJ95820.1 DUF2065 domain-containing protein [Gammaproteobacteria bacterium]